jgi:3-hydroxyacyl-CoA dehydrogenase/enoyl-CoA hydratase/3-hydroxybutyryl-CoA epimerase
LGEIMTHTLVSTSGDLQFDVQNQVCVVTINQSNKSVNSLTIPLIEDLKQAFQTITESGAYRGLVVTSSKRNCFAAGADIGIFEGWKTADEAQKGARDLQLVFDILANAKIPTVAAVHGACLGGGLELSLACHYRLCSSDASTKMGFPEVRLGLIPGAGGTQRAPRLIGIPAALDIILTGKQLDAKKAAKCGLVDEAVPVNQLQQKAVALCLDRSKMAELVSRRPKQSWLKTNFAFRALVSWQTEKTILKTSGGHFPAPLKALKAVMAAFTMAEPDGFVFETKLFGECFATACSNSLIHIFRVITAAKKNPVAEEDVLKSEALWTKDLEEGNRPAGILGAGLMGSGIATVLAEKKIRSVLLDNNREGLARGAARVNEHFEAQVKKRRITLRDRDLAFGRVAPTLSTTSLASSKFVIEAVFEDIKIKHDMIKKCEKEISGDFIFATNTSSLPISEIAKGARKPELVIGMHFFSPVPKMPLVEIIKTPQTRPDVIAATFDVATSMGKNVIVVNDGPGFYTTRVLAFLLAEAVSIVAEGTPVEVVDAAMKKFGWPVGPLTLIDEVGIDVALHVMDTMIQAFPERVARVPGFWNFIEQKRMGRKNGLGFYHYDNDKRGDVDATIYTTLREGISPRPNSAQEIVDRCNFVFMIETLRCLKDGVLERPDDADLGAVFGLGFPPHLGGPVHYARNMGRKTFGDVAQALAKNHGPRFEASDFLDLI